MIDQTTATLIRIGREMQAGGLNAGTAGNLSARLTGGQMLISRRRVRKADLGVDDFVVFDLDGPTATALESASTEYRLHVASYRGDPGVRSVLHAHAPALTAIGLRRSTFPSVLPELETVVGSIVINPFEPSGSERLAGDVGRAVARGAAVIILKRHGVVTVGDSPSHALDRLELAENAARTILLADR